MIRVLIAGPGNMRLAHDGRGAAPGDLKEV